MGWYKGQRVSTNMGPGTIEGFEYFTADGMRSWISDNDLGKDSRVLVRLDDPARWWSRSEAHPHPYFFRSELSELQEAP